MGRRAEGCRPQQVPGRGNEGSHDARFRDLGI